MRIDWTATEGANRLVMIGVAIGVIVIFVGGLLLFTNFVGSNSPQAKATTTTTLANLSTPSTNPQQNNNVRSTTTTLRNGMTQEQIENPEGTIENATQLAFLWNQKQSRLTPPAYEASVKVATAFQLASATGQGQEQFAEYYEKLPNDPWVSNYQFVYATTEATSDPKVVKARVWFSGIEKASGLQIPQAQQGFYLKRSSRDSLDFKPLFLETPSTDPDIGVSVDN